MTKVFSYINELSSGNEMIAGAISLWAMGIFTYFFKEIPQKTCKLLFKNLTTTVTFTSQNPSFYNMLKWFERNGYAEKLRKVKLSEGRWGSDQETIKSVGYGTHVVWFGWVPLWVTLERETNVGDVDKEVMTILKVGRSHKIFNKLSREISKKKKDGFIDVFSAKGGDWYFRSSSPKRGFDSVIVKLSLLEELKSVIDKFIASEDWYVEHGIPYTLGIMLYGPPGTGKSSLIRAIASYTNRSIYSIPASSAASYPDMLQSINKDSITVIEDIDSCSAAKTRNKKDKKNNDNRSSIEIDFEEFMINNISELLNAMDGIVSNHGRILIMTTNYPEKIDAAIMRPGRCDCKIEIGYFNMEMFRRFLLRFFSENIVFNLLNNRALSVDNLTGAELQKCILDKMSCEEIVLKYTLKKIVRSSMTNIYKEKVYVI